MKVGIVMPVADQRGGVERMLMNLLRANRRAPQVDYAVAFLEEGPMVAAVREMGYAAEVFHAGRLRQAHRYVQTVHALRGWLHKTRAQVVLSWAAKGHLYAGPAALSVQVPAAWYVHSLPEGHWMDHLVTLLPARKVFCCGKTAERFQQRMWPRRATSVVYIAVESDRFDPARLPAPAVARRRLQLPEEVLLVGMVARLERWKGVHVFIDAAARVGKRYPETRFIVVGGSHWAAADYPAELEARALRAGITDRVMLVGHQTDVPLWMQAMDVLVHASFGEPTGTVIIEGMAMCKPVVAARSCGPMEFLTEGENGLLAKPGDDEELAGAIERLLADPDERHRLGQAARARALQFSAERLAADAARNLAEILS